MKSNMGAADRVLRVVFGMALACFALFLPGNWRLLGIIGIVLLMTSTVNWCPIYAALGIGTRRGKE